MPDVLEPDGAWGERSIRLERSPWMQGLFVVENKFAEVENKRLQLENKSIKVENKRLQLENKRSGEIQTGNDRTPKNVSTGRNPSSNENAALTAKNCHDPYVNQSALNHSSPELVLRNK
jgi:hypothetical protein